MLISRTRPASPAFRFAGRTLAALGGCCDDTAAGVLACAGAEPPAEAPLRCAPAAALALSCANADDALAFFACSAAAWMLSTGGASRVDLTAAPRLLSAGSVNAACNQHVTSASEHIQVLDVGAARCTRNQTQALLIPRRTGTRKSKSLVVSEQSSVIACVVSSAPSGAFEGALAELMQTLFSRTSATMLSIAAHSTWVWIASVPARGILSTAFAFALA